MSMMSQSGWEPQWQYLVVGRGQKPQRVLFALLDENEPYAMPTKGSHPGVAQITIDEFNRQFEWHEEALHLVELALRRAKAQGIQLPTLMTAADLLAESDVTA